MIVYKIEIPETGSTREVEAGNNHEVEADNNHKINIAEEIHVQYVPLNKSEQESFRHNFNRSWHIEKYGFELSEPEYLHCLTHRKAWELFLATDEEWCCIVEENAEVNIDLQEIENAVELLDENWDVFFPFNKFKEIFGSDLARISSGLINPNLREMVEMDPFYLGFLWGSPLYFVSRKGARLLLSDNEIKQRVDDEFFFLTEHNDLELYYDNFNWFDPERQRGFIPRERLENIHNAVLNYNIWKPEALFSVRQVLSEISKVADQLHVDLILHGGSLLGYIRQGGIMPWDDDVDLGIEESKLDLFLDGIKTLTHLESRMFLEKHTDTFYCKIWDAAGAEIEGYDYKFPFVDIWLYRTDGKNINFNNGITFPDASLHPFLNVDFEGAVFQIPYNAITCLDATYTDWKTNIRIYIWSHQLEKGELQPLTTQIMVDEEGRIMKDGFS